MNEQENKMLQDMTIVMQGRVDPECIKHMVSRYRNNIIISTWEDEDLSACGELDGVRIIKSPKPTEHLEFRNNMLQYTSTLIGLSACTTRYAIKMRGDEYFSNIEKVEEIVRQDARIHCLPIFMPRFKIKPFCVSDHFMAGLHSELSSMFNLAKQWWIKRSKLRVPKIPDIYSNVPECILGATYIHNRSKGLMRPEMMKKYFSIIPLDVVKDYRITWNNAIKDGNGARRFYYNDFDPKVDGRGTITHIDQVTE